MIRLLSWHTLCACALLAGFPGCGSSAPTSSMSDLSGPASSLEICHATCQWDRSCMPSLVTSSCDSDCDNNAGQYEDQDRINDQKCSNAAAVRAQTLACLLMTCSAGQTCLNGINTTCTPT